MKAKCNSNYGFNLNNYDVNKNVEIWVDSFNNLNESKAEKKIFLAIEPEEVMGINQMIIENRNKFDYILTYDENLLKKLDNAVLFEFGTKWVNIDDYKNLKKEFSVSTVCGHKSITKFHKIRHKLWMSQEKINIPKNFFLSKYGGPRLFDGNKILEDSKLPMFESMFHICIENIPKKYFFTEKLIDTLLCKTIPIYWGCTNVEDYFNAKGMIIVNSIDEVIDACNNLTEEDYYNRMEHIEENYREALKWIDHPERIYNKIKDLI
jgi:hypothetical protein